MGRPKGSKNKNCKPKIKKYEPPGLEFIGLDQKLTRYWVEEQNGEFILLRSKKVKRKWQSPYLLHKASEPIEIFNKEDGSISWRFITQ